MIDPIKKKPQIHSATALALKQIVKERQDSYDSLQKNRALFAAELEAGQRELTALISKLDKQILEAKANLEEAQAALSEQRRLAGEIEGHA